MSNSIGTSSPAASPVPAATSTSDALRITSTKGRATPRGPSFGQVLSAARPILKGAEAVATVLPGGPLISAAVRAPTSMARAGGAFAGPASGGARGGTSMVSRAPVSPMSPTVGGIGAGVGAKGVSGDASAPSIDAGGGVGAPGAGAEGGGIESVLADSQAFNMYYLQLQEEISSENRSYSALSNVLKARHDTVKNAIGNVR